MHLSTSTRFSFLSFLALLLPLLLTASPNPVVSATPNGPVQNINIDYVAGSTNTTCQNNGVNFNNYGVNCWGDPWGPVMDGFFSLNIERLYIDGDFFMEVFSKRYPGGPTTWLCSSPQNPIPNFGRPDGVWTVPTNDSSINELQISTGGSDYDTSFCGPNFSPSNLVLSYTGLLTPFHPAGPPYIDPATICKPTYTPNPSSTVNEERYRCIIPNNGTIDWQIWGAITAMLNATTVYPN